MSPQTEEAPEALCIEVSDYSGVSPSDSERQASDMKRVRHIQRKVDMHLVLPLGILYTMAFLDRSNLGNVSGICRALALY